MKNQEVKQLQFELNVLTNYCVQKDVKNFALNRIIRRNSKIIAEAVAEIDADISKDLIALEEEAVRLAEFEISKMSEEQKKKNLNKTEYGLLLLSDEDKKKHEELMIDYKSLMQEECDLKLYILEDLSKIESVDLPLAYDNILSKFLKED